MSINKDYNEIIKEIRGSDLLPEKLEYTIPDDLEIEYIDRGKRTSKFDETPADKRMRGDNGSKWQGWKLGQEIERDDLYPLCNCKTGTTVMHETKVENDCCIFCESYVLWGKWEPSFKTLRQVTKTRQSSNKKPEDFKKEFLAICKELGYNKTKIAEKCGVHINTVRWRMKKWK